MKKIDKLIINSPYEEPQQCGKVGLITTDPTHIFIMMEKGEWNTEGLGREVLIGW
ncbi:MAG: hypothetical protein L6Q53_11025 [Candidatus Brocadia sinica]|nr:hypothetical protein [Candidatus Brocadia sinica]